MKILLGVTGSVAAVLTPKIVTEFIHRGNEVEVIATEKSLYFWKKTDVAVPVWTDEKEWEDTYGVYMLHKSPVVHISRREWADIMVIAPLTANTLAKISNGIADNLLTSIVRAWNVCKPIVIAPAMNTHMWEHPATFEQLTKLKRWMPMLEIVQPVKKMLACGVEGMGALADISTIVEATMSLKEVARVHSYRRP